MDTDFEPVISKKTFGHYRLHPLEFKRSLVALSLEPSASVARIVREHGVNASLLSSLGRHSCPMILACGIAADRARHLRIHVTLPRGGRSDLLPSQGVLEGKSFA